MDPITLAINAGAIAVLAAWKVVDHIVVGRGKDQQISILKERIEQLALLTYKGWNDQAVAMEQSHKREIDLLKREHEIVLETARGEVANAEQRAEELAETRRQLHEATRQSQAVLLSEWHFTSTWRELIDALKDTNISDGVLKALTEPPVIRKELDEPDPSIT